MNLHSVYARISPLFRRRRMAWFTATLQPTAQDEILDVGGTSRFWQDAALQSPITMLNTDVPTESGTQPAPTIQGDGCALPFGDKSFNVVFSNSVIEHVGTWERQQAFAREARRVGTRLWIQTPAREFFVEPHLLAPFIHWLPPSVQRRLVRYFTLRGWIERPDLAAVELLLAEIRLLTFAEMKALFPDCEILRETFLGMTKSYIAVGKT